MKVQKQVKVQATGKIEVGSLVPDFTAQSSSGADVTLSKLKGQMVVLYFYPKDDTPGCTIEGQDFNRLRSDFAKCNAVVFGISKDTHESHCKFRDKYGFEFELLSDIDEKICQSFDVIKRKKHVRKKVYGYRTNNIYYI